MQSRRKHKAALAVIVTSSPFKQQLQETKIEKEVKVLAAQERKRKRDEKREIGRSSQERRKVIRKAAGDKKVKVTEKQTSVEQNDDDSQPLATVILKCKKKGKKGGKGRKKGKRNNITAEMIADEEDSAECKVCHFVYSDPADPLLRDDWVQCAHCKCWLHDSCAQNCGVFDDDEGYLCKNCLKN